MLPADNVLHSSFYEVKKFLKSFDMGYEKIHACVNDCCLFRKKLKKLDSCPKCKASRWKINLHTGEVKKGVPQKLLRYFPIIPRLKRMFRSQEMATNLRWHASNKSSDGKLRHPVDCVTWKQMDAKYPTFAAEERNIRLGLSTDGFNPFSMQNSKYSCWPVLLVNYNLPPNLCMKKENIMLTLLIPGPQQPGNSIDVYLEPVIEDLNQLWRKGESAYDVLSNSVFTLKAMLLWTISDFPAYGNLAGCKVKGKMGCPVCGKHTDSVWMKFCRKHVYMSHRKRLPPTHRILSGQDISSNLKNFVNNFGNVKASGAKRKRTVSVEEDCDMGDDSSESKAEEEDELPVRHNLDVMHIERNVAKIIVSTLLHCGNSKDGLNTRKDMEHLGIRKDLHPKAKGKRTYLPAAPWSLSKSEKKLLPVAVRGLLPKGIRLSILRMCAFFNRVCKRVIDIEQISVMEAEIVETLCMFERFFPPSFFDIMVNLTVHLGREARLCGPVHFRWMYPFERHMKILKDFVRNHARPEGCIAEFYLAEECMQFCSEFLKKTTSVEEKLDMNTDYESQSILEGHPISAARSIDLSEMEKKTIHLAVIQNTAVVEPYVDMHLQHLQETNGRCRRDATYLWSTHTLNFASWLKEQIPIDSGTHDETLKWLAYGPRTNARSYTGYIVNGQRFHTHSVHKQTQNSGVFYEATAMCRAIRGNKVKVEDGFTLVNLNQSHVSFNTDPYILTSQAKQVFYSRENDTSSWYVVLKGQSRRYSEADEEEVNPYIGPLPSSIDMEVEIEDAHNARVDCEGIYV
ncbi:uncharacterized protein LOC106427185 [Brassica napus]|uniref:uncharacterized protein LOC106427185 n=1 Tax=Brassica napus TaxID=3708 RepID=UPI002078734D|nr:uncharacterized protein LOC106427185 [Brassica napus]